MADSRTSASEVWILDFDANRFAGLLCVNEQDLDLLADAFRGEPLGPEWRPIDMYWETDGDTRPRSDFSTIVGGGLVLNERAKEALSDLLEGRGELLPLRVRDDGDHYVFNVTRLSEALNQGRSELAFFRSGRIMDVDRYEFHSSKLSADAIFKLPQIPEMYTFVTDAFRERVDQEGLTGFIFDRQVWTEASAART